MQVMHMIVDAFSYLEFFKALTPAQLAVLKPVFHPCEYSTGNMLFEQDAPAEYLYIVVKGEVVVNFKPDDGPSITVTRAHSGEVVGWSAALTRRAYTSSAAAAVDTQLLKVRGYDLRQVCWHHPDIAKIVQDCLAAVIVQRVSKTHAQVVALLELGLGRSNNIEEFTDGKAND